MDSFDKPNYNLDDRDKLIALAAKDLLWKVVRSSLTNSKQIEILAKAIQTFDALPRASGDHNIIISLTGPRRWFGEHEIWHWWEINIEGGFLQVSSGGHFYRKSTGGDSFSCMYWSASPGSAAELNDT